MRAESRYIRTGGGGGVRDALPPSRHVTFTLTKVLGTIPAGVRCHCALKWMGRCDRGIAAALSFGGGCLECGSVGSGTPASVAVRLVDALTAHYGSPGRLADYRRQFDKTTRTAGEDPSIFAIALGTLAVKAFGDMGQSARLRLIRDRFIAGHNSCDIWTVCRRKPPYGTLWIGAGCGRVMQTRTFGGSVNRDPTRHS